MRKFETIEDYAKNANDFTAKFMAEMLKAKEAWLEDLLRNHLNPPIKGNITRDKIQERGLMLHEYNDLYKFRSALKEGEKTIGCTFEVDYTPPDLNLRD